MFGRTTRRRLMELESQVTELRAAISDIDSTVSKYASTMDVVLAKRARDAKRNLDDTMYRLELLEKKLRPSAEQTRSEYLDDCRRPASNTRAGFGPPRIMKADCVSISNVPRADSGNPVPPNRTYDELPKENDQPAEEGLGARVNARAKLAASKWDQAIADLKAERTKQFAEER